MTSTKDKTPEVDIIPATKRHLEYGDQFHRHENLRVAAYCRVSTEEESQQNSYAAQKNYYTTLILSHPGWELAGIYADEGRSGTSRKGRTDFNRMIDHARLGQLDYIITKSISRFARNTIDALDCVHDLQRLRPPVGVYFERENIDTLNANSEMFLTFYCSMAQEESRSISENIKWSIRKKMAAGEPHVNLSRMLGYDRAADGSWQINEEQAATVRRIFKRYLEGVSANAIAKELNKDGRLTVNGKHWRADTVLNILQNEKYAGDLLMQKTYTESFLTHKTVKNTGELPQYFRSDHHAAIVDRKTWNDTQALLKQKRQGREHQTKKIKTRTGKLEIAISIKGLPKKRGPSPSPFHGLTCKRCGGAMRRMRYNLTRKGNTFSYAVWKCPNSPGRPGTAQQGRTCQAATLAEISMEQAFMKMLYCIRQDYLQNGADSEIMRSFRYAYDSLRQEEHTKGFIEQKLKLLESEIRGLDDLYRKICRKMETEIYSSKLKLGKTHAHKNTSAALPLENTSSAKQAEMLKKMLDQKRAEQTQLTEERGVARYMKENFEDFMRAVINLPENGVDLEKMTSGSLLPFDRYIVQNFIVHIEAWKDEIYYGTTFGLVLTAVGNERPVGSFINPCMKKKTE